MNIKSLKVNGQQRPMGRISSGDGFRFCDRNYLMVGRDGNGHMNVLDQNGQPKLLMYSRSIMVPVDLLDTDLPCPTCDRAQVVPSVSSDNGITYCPTCTPDALRDLIQL
jgi:hypothetical protein